MMNEKKWQTVIVNTCDLLNLSDEQLVITNEHGKTSIPIARIRTILISSDRGSLSLQLLSRLISYNISIIFCDGKRNPIGELSCLGVNGESAGKHMDQAVWTTRKKAAIWKSIVGMKIVNQKELLLSQGDKDVSFMDRCLQTLQSNDCTNREAVAARYYFGRLFGKKFVRFDTDDINNALNYGYAILRNTFSRYVVAYGYGCELGINHCNRHNRFNLPCDLMEPFRPFVDAIVINNVGKLFDNRYKNELLAVLNHECLFDGNRVDVDTAISEFVLDVTKCLSTSRRKLKEVRFAQTC